MKRIIKRALAPEKTFEQWALDNNIKLSKNSSKPVKTLFLRWAAISAAALIVCLAVMLPFLLKKDAPESELPFYMENEAISSRITAINDLKELENFFISNDILFFDFDRVLDFRPLFCDIAKDNNTLILSYYLENCSVAFKDNNLSGFNIDYRILTYKNYEFVSNSYYSNLIPLFEDSGLNVLYKIDSFIDSKVAFVKFSYNKYDYFLKIYDVGAGELTVANLRAFLADLPF